MVNCQTFITIVDRNLLPGLWEEMEKERESERKRREGRGFTDSRWPDWKHWNNCANWILHELIRNDSIGTHINSYVLSARCIIKMELYTMVLRMRIISKNYHLFLPSSMLASTCFLSSSLFLQLCFDFLCIGLVHYLDCISWCSWWLWKYQETKQIIHVMW